MLSSESDMAGNIDRAIEADANEDKEDRRLLVADLVAQRL